MVTLSDEVLETYNKHNTWKFIIFGLVNNNTEIGVIKASLSAKYDDFLHELPKDDCRWAVYDLEYDSGEGKKTKRVFYDWSPETAPVARKMIYASTKSTLRNSLQGIGAEIQGTDLSEVALDVVLEKIKHK